MEVYKMKLNDVMNGSIQNAAATALRFAARSQAEFRFVSKLPPILLDAAKQRDKSEKSGTHIPPFLIASIASQCNLHCAGCYARTGGYCDDEKLDNEMTTERWGELFVQAEKLGISFILLAGGEPLMRCDVLHEAGEYSNIVFPVFTNGTLIDDGYLELFDKHRNLIPVLSIEGGETVTDARRGHGVAIRLRHAANALHSKDILYGVSITVTSDNAEAVTSPEFISELQESACGIVFFVEYVPVDEKSDGLVISVAQRDEQALRVSRLKDKYRDIVFISFPGDEKYLGGCLAAGRGFFHINAVGNAEPCPFSPYSDVNLKEHSLLEAINSPLFFRIKSQDILEMKHSGGCVLFENRSLIGALAK
jgi:MoaA/NifB/PqqE/SkfB family radical SAM enzyme